MPPIVITPRPLPSRFQVAFSFAGEQRDLVRAIAQAAEDLLGRGTVFFDEWFEHYLAGANADVVLQDIYQDRALLTVACISDRYGDKPWTQAEWSAIRALQMRLSASQQENDRLRVLPIRVGDGDVRGLLFNTICPDVRQRTPQEAAQLIANRLGLIQPPSGQPASGAAQPQALRSPIALLRHDTGMMAVDDPWYVERRVDERIFRALSSQSRTVSISGLRGSGLSSLANRVAKRLRDRGYQEVTVDLKTDLRDAAFASADAFFPALAEVVARRVGLGQFGAQSVASGRMLADFLLSLASAAGGRFLLTLDAFDHLFSRPATVEIQSHLRSFHNAVAAPPLNQLRLVLVHTIAPPLGPSTAGSVFDVAEKFVAEDFSLEEVGHLVSLYGNPIEKPEVESLHGLLAGHPAFTRRALNYMLEENEAFGDFRAEVAATGGIFLDDMRALLLGFDTPPLLSRRIALARAMYHLQPCGSETDYEVLHSLGLIRGTFSGDAVPRCLMFEKWFSSRLTSPGAAPRRVARSAVPRAGRP